MEFIIGISTDKVASVSGTYGATKFLMESLFTQYERINKRVKYRLVRYGNVLYSSGSVLCLWKDKLLNGEEITITDRNITRFYWHIDEAIKQAGKIVPITQAKTLIAVAGTATTVAAAALNLSEYDRYAIHLSRITAQQVHETSQMFLTKTREERLTLGYMHPGRVDVIPAGALVLSEIMSATGASEFVASESDILDGIARSLAGKGA